ncbi:MAG: N-acetylneuraminate synthase family protein [Chloroflexota bacterium]|nr:N-acetylneuraminate synthase family protein [Chloroflexota bacterium]
MVDWLDSNGSVFVIAEIGNNHNGDVDLAKSMIDAAVEAGADCVKFQMRNLDEVYRKKSLSKSGDDLGSEYVIDLLNRFELTVDEHRCLYDYCRSKNVTYMCTPWDSESLTTLESFNVEAYKIASADFSNWALIKEVAATRKPMILSTGMSSEEDIRETVSFLGQLGSEFALLHCNSTYPAPFQDINLRWIPQMKAIHPLVGYSGHERGIAVSIAAVALGAEIIERHLTFDRSMEGPDHAASLTPAEFKSLVDGIREVEAALGSGSSRQISQGEMINRENLAKSLVARSSLKRGHLITEADVSIKSPGQGLSPKKMSKLIGKTLKRDIESEGFFYDSDLSEGILEARQYKFKRPWGIPIRYHDFDSFMGMCDPDFVEFHLSYSDMELDPRDFLSDVQACGFVVHAPELFSGSRLMDLASEDEDYRAFSIEQTNRVIQITRDLKEYFPNEIRPMIVANIGGFTMDATLPSSVLTQYYERFADSLSELDIEGVELLPQTMAPFPWHFGGQRFQNLFVHADDCVEWCERLGLRMCLDVSHSRLTCNHFGCDFYEFLSKVGPYAAHLHLGDALGVNGEGLQIGEGDIDFDRVGQILATAAPGAYFIPEIWQGHKDMGMGFWQALEKLEGRL